MKFKTDENLPVEVTDLLRTQGHDALTAADQHLAGHPDSDLASVCRSERRIMVSLDLDFSDIRSYPPQEFPGIIVLRPGLQSIGAILRVMNRVIRLLETEAPAGNLWIAEPHQVRIREPEGQP